MRYAFFATILCASLLGCAPAPRHERINAAPPPAAASIAPPASAIDTSPNDNLNAVAWSQTAIEHELIYREVFRSASERLRGALNDPQWDALPKTERKHALSPRLKPAVIVDIDETMLDTSAYQARLVDQNKEFDEASWAAWCREQRAKPLPGALDFAQAAARLGVTVFYISNRAQDLDTATLANLRADGFPVADDETVFLGLGTVVEGCAQSGHDKGCRRELVGRTHRVLMQLGDQLGDFVDLGTNTLDGRRTAIEPYRSWIGERWFVLPNPTYGSWEPALFNNEWSRPAALRREAKLKALRLE